MVKIRGATQPMDEVYNFQYESFVDRLVETKRLDADQAEIAKQSITQKLPIIYWSMEVYDIEHGIKGGGGLGVLAADTRRLSQELGIPLVLVTPFYTSQSHQCLRRFDSHYTDRPTDITPYFKIQGETSIHTAGKQPTDLSYYSRDFGSTKIITVSEPLFGELYPGGNSDDKRLYQEVALGFGGFRALNHLGIRGSFWQLNEAPTVFAAIALVDDLIMRGVSLSEALAHVRSKLLYTNHTLVAAVEAKFSLAQFDRFVRPNLQSPTTWFWLSGLFRADATVQLSQLAIELSSVQSGVSKLHAQVADYRDLRGNKVKFQAVTNGISSHWIPSRVRNFYARAGLIDEFGLPTTDYQNNLNRLDIPSIRSLREQGKSELLEVLKSRRDQYGNPINIPIDSFIYDFKRRFAGYKRQDLVFTDPSRLSEILDTNNAHYIFTGKPHPDDREMQAKLTELLTLIDQTPGLKGRVHYIQDYDEELGRALSIGSDCAINVPIVGQEACGTSWMKDIINFKVLISTHDGGVADVPPGSYLEVSGPGEVESLYSQMQRAAVINYYDDQLWHHLARQIGAYLPTISGSRMMADYLKLFVGGH